MKIICTQEEKEWLIEAIMNSDSHCFFVEDYSYMNCGDNCKDCLYKKIEWEIKGGESE